MPNKIHWIRDANVGPTKVITHCGMEGYANRDIRCEFTNTFGDRFEAYRVLSHVTCYRCLKSAERISNSPWGHGGKR